MPIGNINKLNKQHVLLVSTVELCPLMIDGTLAMILVQQVVKNLFCCFLALRSPPVAMAAPHTTLPLPTAILEMFNEEGTSC